MTIIIETPRLLLRTWKETDRDPYFKINQDPKVLEFLGEPLTLEQVDSFITTANLHQEKHGYTLWAAELKKKVMLQKGLKRRWRMGFSRVD